MSYDWIPLQSVILTESLFSQMRPEVILDGDEFAREASFLMAEQFMVQHLNTPLSPTTITGTYMWYPGKDRLLLPHTYMQSIDQVLVWSQDSQCNCSLSSETGCGFMVGSWGYVHLRVISSAWSSGCGCGGTRPFKYEVTWTAGLPTGTSAVDRRLHMGLSLLAEEFLKDFTDPGAHEGGPGDVGIQSFSNLGYQETRVKLEKTVFGQTAMGNYVTRLVSHLKRKRPMKFS